MNAEFDIPEERGEIPWPVIYGRNWTKFGKPVSGDSAFLAYEPGQWIAVGVVDGVTPAAGVADSYILAGITPVDQFASATLAKVLLEQIPVNLLHPETTRYTFPLEVNKAYVKQCGQEGGVELNKTLVDQYPWATFAYAFADFKNDRLIAGGYGDCIGIMLVRSQEDRSTFIPRIYMPELEFIPLGFAYNLAADELKIRFRDTMTPKDLRDLLGANEFFRQTYQRKRLKDTPTSFDKAEYAFPFYISRFDVPSTLYLGVNKPVSISNAGGIALMTDGSIPDWFLRALVRGDQSEQTKLAMQEYIIKLFTNPSLATFPEMLEAYDDGTVRIMAWDKIHAQNILFPEIHNSANAVETGLEINLSVFQFVHDILSREKWGDISLSQPFLSALQQLYGDLDVYFRSRINLHEAIRLYRGEGNPYILEGTRGFVDPNQHED